MPPVVATWLPMETDVRAAARAARRSQPFVVRNSTRLAAAVVTAVLVLLAVLGLPVWSVLGGPLFLLAFGPWMELRGTWMRSGPYIKHSVLATVDEQGLRYTGNGILDFDQLWPWDRFDYVVETEDLFVFVGLKNKAGFMPYVPKRAVDPDALRAVIPVEVRAQ